jgi:hypothetical protein
MALDNDHLTQFVDTDNESDEDKPSKKPSVPKHESVDDNQFKNSLSFKGGKGSNSGLYYVNYNDAKGGNELDPESKNQLFTDVAAAETNLAVLKNTLGTVRAKTAKLLSEPMNDELNHHLALAESESSELSDQRELASKLKVNEKHVTQTKKRVGYFATFWRKRRKLCMDFLITMEELTDGALTAKKCLSCAGPVDIDGDEACAKLAIEFGKKKQNRSTTTNGKALQSAIKSTKSKSGIQSCETFVAVLLDAQGKVQRVHMNDGDSLK